MSDKFVCICLSTLIAPVTPSSIPASIASSTFGLMPVARTAKSPFIICPDSNFA